QGSDFFVEAFEKLKDEAKKTDINNASSNFFLFFTSPLYHRQKKWKSSLL
ncbi:unnamed protein product, partial [marine sediment metagenome]